MSSNTENTNPSTSPTEQPKKKSLYQRYWDFKNHRNKQISDEDMLKFTGKSRAELKEWSKTAPGVAGNQPAGTIAAGPAHGIAGSAAGEGLGGWGFDTPGKLKYPNQGEQKKKGKKLEDDSD
ncbi:hypothetical protein QBC38DRAFT_481743 [Podospora fimiseda]|uniref:Uncharacterized protein n=1 Tax=Podospora fimiseda TaxID=252190 RepID=A0AAN7BLU7_9PEZI|nr:hypothetical protein QBC38DRAFT_481743 [Podospora fimiseda]